MTRKTSLCEGYRDGNGDRLAQSLLAFYLQTLARGHLGNFSFPVARWTNSRATLPRLTAVAKRLPVAASGRSHNAQPTEWKWPVGRCKTKGLPAHGRTETRTT